MIDSIMMNNNNSMRLEPLRAVMTVGATCAFLTAPADTNWSDPTHKVTLAQEVKSLFCEKAAWLRSVDVNLAWTCQGEVSGNRSENKEAVGGRR